MRLIDADALKKVLEPIAEHLNDSLYGDGIYRALKEIDSSPTVMNGRDYDLYLAGYKQGKKGLDRPKGEWISPSENTEISNKDFFNDCSICGYTQMDESNFCPNCGADMRGNNK